MGSRRAAAGWSCFWDHLPKPAGHGAGVQARTTHRGRLRPGQILHFGPDLQAEIVSLPEPGVAEVRFLESADALNRILVHGEVPLPPYIQRPAGEADRDNYQTVFAREPRRRGLPHRGPALHQ